MQILLNVTLQLLINTVYYTVAAVATTTIR